jgi:hypothetical protein
MTIKYAIFNPMTGLYSFATSVDERNSSILNTALSFYKSYSSENFYSVVTVQEDGSEIWTTPDGEQLKSPKELEAIQLDWKEYLKNNPI